MTLRTVSIIRVPSQYYCFKSYTAKKCQRKAIPKMHREYSTGWTEPYKYTLVGLTNFKLNGQDLS